MLLLSKGSAFREGSIAQAGVKTFFIPTPAESLPFIGGGLPFPPGPNPSKCVLTPHGRGKALYRSLIETELTAAGDAKTFVHPGS